MLITKIGQRYALQLPVVWFN